MKSRTYIVEYGLRNNKKSRASVSSREEAIDFIKNYFRSQADTFRDLLSAPYNYNFPEATIIERVENFAAKKVKESTESFAFDYDYWLWNNSDT